jgi:hypothetical protein
MITQAGKKTLSQNPALPSSAGVIEDFLQVVKIGRVQTTLVRGKAQEIITWVDTMASRQPMSESLSVRKEGERSWRWHVFHVLPDVLLGTGEVIEFQGMRYKIMEKEDWSQYGFLKYNAIEQFSPSVTS